MTFYSTSEAILTIQLETFYFLSTSISFSSSNCLSTLNKLSTKTRAVVLTHTYGVTLIREHYQPRSKHACFLFPYCLHSVLSSPHSPKFVTMAKKCFSSAKVCHRRPSGAFVGGLSQCCSELYQRIDSHREYGATLI